MTPAQVKVQEAAAEQLSRARHEIGELDRQMVALIARRVALATAAGRAKSRAGLPTADPKREAVVLRNVAMAAREEQLDEDAVRHIFWCIIDLCRRAQAPAAS